MNNNWKQIVKEKVSSDVFKKLTKYVNLVLEYNKLMNLTGFDDNRIWKEGIYQSIFLLDNQIKNDKQFKMLDIGAGAGFPSIPYLIYKENNFELTIVEPIKKRTMFLNIVKEELSLNVEIINERAESFKKINYFDFICARAVAELRILIEISIQLGKIGSKYIWLKSNDAKEELLKAQWIIEQLKLKSIDINLIDINDNKHHVVVSYIKTNNISNKFPRKWKIIKNNEIN